MPLCRLLLAESSIALLLASCDYCVGNVSSALLAEIDQVNPRYCSCALHRPIRTSMRTVAENCSSAHQIYNMAMIGGLMYCLRCSNP